ncbi:cAMP-binding domain of CRP or a regulatory subunit of cAMP-dependent protein kinases [Maribacter orientalis]|uniref:cAMP-binding domain of CRP or a regulatory subunit of cAMP-dependent protein kinases n=1 Tax=Maribacter orientalis TaxID=228957 RepID=A0A1H7FR78_9FLAO|nr:Crp/Fnr family transcriptional regulator [Maribacter orientalis]SEK26992.1 cAMP-binding domain of CRP or a regulatory subunit of cAMP-dependent protein kinases [Maribacter orientalis]
MKTKIETLHLENLKKKILSYTQVDDEMVEEQMQFYQRIDLKKGDTLVTPGQLVDYFYYVATGCIYYYKLDEGEQKVLEFYTDDIFFTDLPAYVKGTPSNYYLKASEATVVYAIKKLDAENSFSRSHQLERFGRLSMQEAFIKIFTRVERLNSRTNEERYLRLIKKRPDLFQRVPQYLIASYLGLTPVGLSKLRKRLGKG